MTRSLRRQALAALSTVSINLSFLLTTNSAVLFGFKEIYTRTKKISAEDIIWWRFFNDYGSI